MNTYQKKLDDWRGYQKQDGKLHHLNFSNTGVMTLLNTNLFSMIQAIQEVFQVKSEGEGIILKKKLTKISFDEKMVNTNGN